MAVRKRAADKAPKALAGELVKGFQSTVVKEFGKGEVLKSYLEDFLKNVENGLEEFKGSPELHFNVYRHEDDSVCVKGWYNHHGRGRSSFWGGSNGVVIQPDHTTSKNKFTVVYAADDREDTKHKSMEEVARNLAQDVFESMPEEFRKDVAASYVVAKDEGDAPAAG